MSSCWESSTHAQVSAAITTGPRLVKSGHGVDGCVQLRREIPVVPRCRAQAVEHHEAESQHQAIVAQLVARRISVNRHEVSAFHHILHVLCIEDGDVVVHAFLDATQNLSGMITKTTHALVSRFRRATLPLSRSEVLE